MGVPFHRAGAVVALAAASSLAFVTTSGAINETSGNQSEKPAPREIPATWQAFAARVQVKFQQRLAGDDAAAKQFQDYMTRRFDKPGTPPPSVIVRAWIGGDGKVDRLEFEGVFDLDVIVNLRAVLVSADVGTPPPPEMPQPLRLRLLLGRAG
jgi:hypothetical protein